MRYKITIKWKSKSVPHPETVALNKIIRQYIERQVDNETISTDKSTYRRS